jgi:prepilin-type N-terminal cleavage/methylation domain-containing protein/prepilin-type processing-associated H-X9-DG protein
VKPGAKGRCRSAFTLLELLVVVAVVALLVSLLLPSLSKASHAARATMCAANVRSLCIAQLAYANEHEGQLVAYGLSHGGSASNAKYSWTNDLQNNADSVLDIKSPLDTSPHWSPRFGGTGQAAPGTNPPRYRISSYGLNEYVTPKGPFDPANPAARPFDKIDRIKNPVATVQWVTMAFTGSFAASDHVHSSECWSEDWSPDTSASQAAKQVQTNAVGGQEGTAVARANYGYLDGHVGADRFNEVYQTPQRNRFDPRIAR